MQESSRNAWGSAEGWTMNQSRAYGSGLVEISRWATFRGVSATDHLIRKKYMIQHSDSWKKHHVRRL